MDSWVIFFPMKFPAMLFPARSSGIGDPSAVGSNVGFRVASVPESTSILLTMLASGVILIRRKR